MLPNWIYRIERLVINRNTGQWCQAPYPNHPKGCPKYDQSEGCPPKAPAVKDYFDISTPLYFVHSEFDLAIHIAEMKKKYPKWTLLQCKCVLYWQNTSRKQLRKRISEAFSILGANASTECPEGMGVNVYATARLAGLKLERIRHLSTCRHVALIGIRRGSVEAKQLKLF